MLQIIFKSFYHFINALLAVGGMGYFELLTVRRAIRLGELVGTPEHDGGITHKERSAVIVAIADQ